MKNKVYETVIIGAGISGLACARKLHDNGKEFLVISKDIGGRILTSEDGKINYGAYMLYEHYHNVKPFAKKERNFSCLDLLFHKGPDSYRIIPRIFFVYPLQTLKFRFLIFKFLKHYENFKKKCEKVSQAQALKDDPFLFSLYNQNAMELVDKYDLKGIVEDYAGAMCRAALFVPVNKISAFTCLWGASTLFIPFFEFTFSIGEMMEGFKKDILLDTVTSITKSNDLYVIRTIRKVFFAKNVVVATPPHVSQKLLSLKEIKEQSGCHLFHVSGKLREPWNRESLNFISEESLLFALFQQRDGSSLIYSKTDKLEFDKYYHDYKIIAHKFWNPAFNLSGDVLWECEQDKNLYLIGDHNICFVEDAYITGLYAANRIIGSKA